MNLLRYHTILEGIWQIIPICRKPMLQVVLSIYRQTRHQLEMNWQVVVVIRNEFSRGERRENIDI